MWRGYSSPPGGSGLSVANALITWRDIHSVPATLQQLGGGVAACRSVVVASAPYDAVAPIYAYATSPLEVTVAGALRVDAPGVGTLFVVGSVQGASVARFFVPLSGSDGTLVLTQRMLNTAITSVATGARPGAMLNLRVDIDSLARDCLRSADFGSAFSAAIVRLGFPTTGGAGGAVEFGDYVRRLALENLTTYEALQALGKLTGEQLSSVATDVNVVSTNLLNYDHDHFGVTVSMDSYPAGPVAVPIQVPDWVRQQSVLLADGSFDIARFTCAFRYRLGAGINSNPGVYVIRRHRMPPVDSSSRMMVLFVEHVFEAGCTAPPQITLSCVRVR